MKCDDLYGWLGEPSLEAAKCTTQILLNLPAVLHESYFWGGDYYKFETSGQGECRLYFNFHAIDKEWHFEEYRQFVLIMSVSGHPDAIKIQELLTKEKHFELLERKIW